MRDVTEALDIIDELDEDLRQHALRYLREIENEMRAMAEEQKQKFLNFLLGCPSSVCKIEQEAV